MNFSFDWNNPQSLAIGGAFLGFLLSMVFDAIYWKRKYNQSGMGAKIQALHERAGAANKLQDRVAVLEQERASLAAKLESFAGGDNGPLVQEFKARAEAAERELGIARRDLAAAGSGASEQVASLRQRAEVAENSLADAQARISRYGEMAAELALVKNHLGERDKEISALKAAGSAESNGGDNEKLRTRAEEAERYVQVLKLEMSQMAPQNEVKFWQDKAAEAEALLDELKSSAGDSKQVEELRVRNQQAQAEIERLRVELACVADKPNSEPNEAIEQLTSEKVDLERQLNQTRQEAEKVLSELQGKLDAAASAPGSEEASRHIESLTHQLEESQFQIAELRQELGKFEAAKAELQAAKAKIESLVTEAAQAPVLDNSEIDILRQELTSLQESFAAANLQLEEFKAQPIASREDESARVSTLEKERTALLAKLDAAKRSAEADAAVAQAAEARIELAEHELETLRTKLKEKEQATAIELSMVTESLQKENASLKAQTAQFEEHVKSLFDKLQTELAAQQQSRAELEVELDRLRGEMSQTLNDSRRETSVITEALQAEQEDHVTTRNEMAELRKSLGDHRAKLEQLEGAAHERDRHLAELEALRQENSNLARAAGAAQQLREDVERLKAEVDGLQSVVAEKERAVLKLENFGAERESLRDELASAKARIEMLEKEGVSPSGANSTQGNLAELKEVLESISKDEPSSVQTRPAVDDVDSRFANLEQALKAAEERLSESRGRMSSVKAELEELRTGTQFEPVTSKTASEASESKEDASVSLLLPLGQIESMPSPVRDSLANVGIRMYSQLAMTPAARVAEITGHESLEDIERWISEAVRFARSEGA